MGWRKIATPNLIQEGEGFTLDSSDTNMYLSDDMGGVGEANNGIDQEKQVEPSETNSLTGLRFAQPPEEKFQTNSKIVYFAYFLHLSAMMAQREAATFMKIDLLDFRHVRSSPPIPSMGPLWPDPKPHTKIYASHWNRC